MSQKNNCASRHALSGWQSPTFESYEQEVLNNHKIIFISWSWPELVLLSMVIYLGEQYILHNTDIHQCEILIASPPCPKEHQKQPEKQIVMLKL